MSFEVTVVGPDFIQGSGETIAFVDIRQLVKHSWTKPDNPCGGAKPPACDIPAVVRIFSDYVDAMSDRFHSACVTHDYCYGHGFATYGASRDECDRLFYDDLKKECAGVASLGVLDAEEFAECRVVAKRIYETVRLYGEKYYLSSGSTVCEYRLLD